MTRRTLLSVVAALSFILLMIPPQRFTSVFAAASPPKTLTGAVPAVVASGRAQRESNLPAGTTLTITVGLALRDRAALAQTLSDLNDPSNPRYHQYLSQDQANQLFNPTVAQEQRVTAWLQQHGLSVIHTYPNHLMVDARGTVDQIQRLFQVSLAQYRVTVAGKQQAFYAPDRNPVIDSAVSDVVDSVTGLDSFPRFHTGFTNGIAHGSAPYYPQDFANAYDVNPLWNAGYTGTGQHIGITLWTAPPTDSTLQTFGSTTGAAVATQANGRLKVIQVDGGTTMGDDGEAGLDIEYTSGMASGATIDYYEMPTISGSPTDQGILDALNVAGTDANNNRTISSSWGGCEASSAGDPWTVSAEKIFASNTTTGHNYFFSTGDNGSWCDPNSTGVGVDPYPQYPASSPNVTAVGGTRFNGNVGTTFPGEAAWTYCSTCNQGVPEGSGGGYSTIFTRPSWQTGTGLAANGKRGYPDIAADADPNTGALFCYGTASTCGDVGGTSLSTPLWAGMTALINQYLAAQSKPALGFLPPSLYKLATAGGTYPPFHDTTSGSNGKYNAGVAWDAVTGWGSPDLYNLARDLAGASGGNGSTPTPTATPKATSTPTVTPTGTIKPTATSTPRPTSTPVPTTQVVQDSDFEGTSNPWTMTAGMVTASTAQAHDGTHSASFCGINWCLGTLSQSVTLPATITQATFSYWAYIISQDTGFCTDGLTSQIQTTGGTVIAFGQTECNSNTNGWVRLSADISSQLKTYAGQTVKVVLKGSTDTQLPTTFYVDDVNLTISSGTGSTSTATPTPTSTAHPTATSTAHPTATSTAHPTATSTPRPTSTPTTTPTGSTSTCSSSTCTQAMLTMLNTDRASYGVAPLTLNAQESNGSWVCVGSYGHSVHMASLGAISHDQFPADICISYTTAGENVGEAAYGNTLTDLQQLDSMMMAENVPLKTPGCSGSHACNIINPAFHQVGIGIYHDSTGKTWLTEDFTN